MINVDNQIIFTNKAKCRDCYRCIRSCKVKAISMRNSQAFVNDLNCIKCGICIKECPQNAKNYLSDIDKFENFLTNNDRVAVSIAPSFPGVFSKWQLFRLSSFLRSIGCSYVAETAVGAYFSAVESAKFINAHPDQSHISGSCPAVVNYIEKYIPEAVDLLIPVVSPMIAHAKIIKEKMGYDTKVVFIGPCVAKKGEAQRREYTGLVDASLTFDELNYYITENKIDLKNYEISDFDEHPQGNSRLFPLLGGMLKSADLSDNNLLENIISVSGADEVKQSIQLMTNTDTNIILEPLFCANGCIDGPGIKSDRNLFERRNAIINYNSTTKKTIINETVESSFLSTKFSKDAYIQKKIYTESEIKKILEQTGKTHKEDELNCGACGYNSCREKAIAVLEGMAEIEMCIPYMRRLAEQRTDKIMQSSPNGIIILNENFEILQMNPAFKKMFTCDDSIAGRSLSYLIDPEYFMKLSTSSDEMIEQTVEYKPYNVICHQIIYKLHQDKQYVGIFVNITNHTKNSKLLEELRKKTITQAQSLMDHQITLAQNIAKMLGESTAQSEELVENLIKLNNEQIV